MAKLEILFHISAFEVSYVTVFAFCYDNFSFLRDNFSFLLRQILLSPWKFFLSYKIFFITNFLTSVTKFVTKAILYERKNYLADNENYLADSDARNGLLGEGVGKDVCRKVVQLDRQMDDQVLDKTNPSLVTGLRCKPYTRNPFDYSLLCELVLDWRVFRGK